jgi:hypothetical protein
VVPEPVLTSPDRAPPGWLRRYLPLFPVLAVAQLLFFLETRARYLFTLGDRTYAFLFEDAMISMRYAYNLAHGDGLVFNPGERVQGYTNLGWTLIMAAAHAIEPSLEWAALPVMAVGFVCHAVLIIVVFTLARPLGAWLSLLAALLVGLNGSVLLWGGGGMETTLMAILVTLAFAPWLPGLRVGIPRALAPLFAGLAFVVRADGLLLFALASLLVVLQARRHRRLVLGVAAGMVPVLAVLMFQRLYYDRWLPNTFAAKVSGGSTDLGRGLGYLWRSVASDTFNAPLLLGALFGLWAERRQRRWLAPGLVLASWLGYVAWVGGDAFVGARFLIPVLPLMALLSARGMGAAWALLRESKARLVALRPRDRVLAADLVLLLTLAFFAMLVRHEQLLWRSHRAYARPTNPHVSSLIVGLAIARSPLPTERPVAVLAAGITPYFAPHHRFHDMLGKCDRHIAATPAHPGMPGHRKWDLRYSLDVIQPSAVVTSAPYDTSLPDESYQRALANERDSPFFPALWIDPTFKARFRPNRVRILFAGRPVETGHWVFVADDLPVRPLVIEP